mmetsp:Transcript_352/g.355  ORF Transcript_352/g.355 Transcript_352/m.355 type:complete len:125 (+) Transcript_352:1-375(+)
MTSILRGIGKEHTAVAVFATGYYALGLPFAFFFGNILGWETNGIWWGLMVGYLFNGIATTVAFLKVDLGLQAQIISERIEGKINASCCFEEKTQVRSEGPFQMIELKSIPYESPESPGKKLLSP